MSNIEMSGHKELNRLSPPINNFNSDADSEQDLSPSYTDDDISRDLHAIGNFGSLKLSNFWRSNTENSVSERDASLLCKEPGSIQSRREQLTTFIEDLKKGFSLRTALDRFQTIRTLLESQVSETIDNNVDTDSEDENKNEPQIVKPAVEPKDLPLLDQVIIPQSKEPRTHKKRKLKHRNRCFDSEYEKLTLMQNDEKNNEAILRERISKIRKLSISERERSLMVQKLMMGAHYNKIKFVDEDGAEVLQVPTNKKLPGVEDIVGEGDKEGNNNDDSEEEVIVNECDKQVSYHDGEEQILGCPHYQKNCKMECPKCRKWFSCPICHDEAITDHKFERNLTRHIMCLNCFIPQKPNEFCLNCDIKFAAYFCSTCKLYDNDESKDIYHCDDCGICRLGLGLGQDFFHCKGCNACLSIELQNDHKCIERSIEADCPICSEFMFTSTKPVVFMSCGHSIHQHCYEEHSKHSYKCPTCQKTVLNMEAQFRVLDMEINLQPLPQPYCHWTCIVKCNDCNAKSSSPYHVLGLKCDNCKSYNTVQLRLIKPEETEYESDISTTTNQLRERNIRDLRSISVNSNLLNTNYNIENQENERENTPPITTEEDENDGKGDNEQFTLTLPRQFMNNFDYYMNNLQNDFSLSDESDDEDLDFLRVNKTLSKFHNETDTPDSTGEKNEFSTSNKADFSITYSKSFLTNALNSFLNHGLMDNDENESDDEYDSDDQINGF
ncbi:hypothetical protein WICMUC_002341 [Wickerhamomyces mucosus]|uniref:Uncharacterized protein n=1 Tax=Wickerhamomyces mucosus TaxID=1378264 RepID=A0A9P8PQX6_9ASCO|nr:hypothetical protein WICMUC_002341 [Wickerhamomyces mucosus]